jgi:hypothetical protein
MTEDKSKDPENKPDPAPVHRVVMPGSTWVRSAFGSFWSGPRIELIVVQNSGSDESWSWTARGWRQPDDDWGANKWGWVNTTTREAAENAALRFYMQKDE